MVGITMATDFNTTDFVTQMNHFQASDDARQKLFAVGPPLVVVSVTSDKNSICLSSIPLC